MAAQALTSATCMVEAAAVKVVMATAGKLGAAPQTVLGTVKG